MNGGNISSSQPLFMMEYELSLELTPREESWESSAVSLTVRPPQHQIAGTVFIRPVRPLRINWKSAGPWNKENRRIPGFQSVRLMPTVCLSSSKRFPW